MSRQIHQAKFRKDAKPRREPYWGPPIARGQFVGYRKIDSLTATWIARYREADGKQSYESLGPDTAAFGYELAREAAVKWFRLKERGGGTGEVNTVEDACKRYVIERRTGKSEDCAHDAMKRFEREVYEHTIGAVKLRKVNAVLITAWRDGLDLLPDAANRTLTALKAALYLAIREKNVGGDLWQELRNVKEVPGGGKRREVYLDIDQRRALIAAAEGTLKDLILSAAHTGARPGELSRARRSQFDHRTQVFSVHAGVRGAKTGARQVPLSTAAVEHFKRLSESKLPAAFLHTRDDGKPYGHSDYDEDFKAAVRAAGLPEKTVLYSMRHSWITDALLGGMTAFEVAKLVGTSLAMIEKHYGHIRPRGSNERLDRVQMV